MTWLTRRLHNDCNPFSALDSLEGNFKDLFAWSPAMDVTETKDHLHIKADLPGIDKDHVKVSIEEGVLTIEGTKQEDKEENKGDVLRKERFYGSFYRSVSLPSGIDSTQTKARFKNGVLELTFPKKEEAKARQIQVDIE
jgi:HSP20 family protein